MVGRPRLPAAPAEQGCPLLALITVDSCSAGQDIACIQGHANPPLSGSAISQDNFSKEVSNLLSDSEGKHGKALTFHNVLLPPVSVTGCILQKKTGTSRVLPTPSSLAPFASQTERLPARRSRNAEMQKQESLIIKYWIHGDAY